MTADLPRIIHDTNLISCNGIFKDLSKVKFTAWFIAVIIIARWVVIFGSTLSQNINGLTDTLFDLIAIIIYVGLIILGTRIKDRT